MKNEGMQNHSRWTRTCVTKTVITVVILLISVQYLVNVAVFRRNDSIIFLQLFESPLGKMLNQTGLNVKGRMRNTVTKMEKPLEPCPIIPPKLKGHIKVNAQVAAWAYIEQENAMVKRGGRYKPSGCIARNRVAVIIPYRDRVIHLKIFLKNMHPFLQRQQLDYGIFVVEMAKDVKFNRALLMNVGFLEAMKQYDYQCFIFHDVDLLPEDDRNLYTCPEFPRHMSVAIDRLQYKLPYAQIFGGVSAISTGHFRKINGFSNIYFGWGGEDDDMYRRILYSNLTVIRYSPEVARYKMLIHAKENGNSERFMLLRTVKARQKTDGITSLKYKVEKMELTSLYTWILVSVNETELVDAEPIHKLAAKHLQRGMANTKSVQGKVGQRKVEPHVNNAKVAPKAAQPANKNTNQPANVAKADDKNKINKGNVAAVENKKPANQGNIDKAKGEQLVNAGKEVKINVNKDKNNVKEIKKENKESNKQNAASVKQAVKDNIVKPKEPTNNVQKQKQVKAAPKANEPKIKLIAGLARRKSIKFVSWIPKEFKGILPTNLTKFDPLPRIVPAHVNKKKTLRDRIAKSKLQQKQIIINRAKAKAGLNVKNLKAANGAIKQLPQQKNKALPVGTGSGNIQVKTNKGIVQTIVNPESVKSVISLVKQTKNIKTLR